MPILTYAEILIAGLLGALATLEARRRYERCKSMRKHEQLLLQGLRLRGIDQPLSRKCLSERRAEMEQLLAQLKTSADALAEALAVESGSIPGTAESIAAASEWKLARGAVTDAQEAYNRAARDYREFIEALPLPLRAKAVERGTAFMRVSHA